MGAWKLGDVALAKYPRESPEVYMRKRVTGGDQERWESAPGTYTADFSCAEWWRLLVVIDPENRAQVERLRDEFDRQVIVQNDDPRPQDVTPGQRGNALQAALRSLIAPPPRWTDGDVVQQESGNYSAQRHNGEWFTTTGPGNTSEAWGSDQYVSNHVDAGKLRVLREQRAEVTP